MVDWKLGKKQVVSYHLTDRPCVTLHHVRFYFIQVKTILIKAGG